MAVRLSADLGDRRIRQVLDDGEHEVGSAPGTAVFLPHPTVSRRHAVLRVTGAPGRGASRLEVEDLGSTNGTFLDGRRLREAAEAPAGSALGFGTVAVEVTVVSDADLELGVAVDRDPSGNAAPSGEGNAPEPSRAAARGGSSSTSLEGEPLPASRVASALDLGDPPPTTASIGSLRVLVVESLPRLLDLLAERPGALPMAQAVGDVVFRSLPCLAVEVVGLESGGRGLLFQAERVPGALGALTPPPGSGAELAAATNDRLVLARDGRCEVRVAFPHPSQAAAFAPLVAALGRLVGAASGPRRRLEAEAPRPAPPQPRPSSVVPEVQRLYADARRVAPGEVSVLIQGESGTGKEVLARFVHAASRRATGPFVALNCAALPRDLLEAELFGIEERVATGVAPRPGKFELADGGTLFLDEIADMAAETQARILRVLQEGEVHRIGGSAPRPARVRTVAATNRDLENLVAAGTFRLDLFHRIADWRVELPPLRRRRADLPNLAAWFLAEEAERRGLRVAGISRAALDALAAYPWPGNVRQLQREMARAALFLEDGEMLETVHLAPEIRRHGAAAGAPGGGFAGAGGVGGATLRERLLAAERREIVDALERQGGDVPAAARELGIGRSTLYRRMAELEVERRGDEER